MVMLSHMEEALTLHAQLAAMPMLERDDAAIHAHLAATLVEPHNPPLQAPLTLNLKTFIQMRLVSIVLAFIHHQQGASPHVPCYCGAYFMILPQRLWPRAPGCQVLQVL